MYLIDTSVWIDFLRGYDTSRVALLEELLAAGEAAICEVVYAEILWGAQTEKQYLKFESYFSAMPFLALPLGWHESLAKIGHSLRRQGYKPFVADTLIALSAITHGATLLTNDTDFDKYTEPHGLQVE